MSMPDDEIYSGYWQSTVQKRKHTGGVIILALV